MSTAHQLAPNAPMAAHVHASDRRRAEREDVSLDTLMTDREGKSFGASIINLSRTGYMARTENDLCERAPVRIDLPTVGWMRADVVWVLGDKIGAQFREPLEEHAFDTFKRLFG